MLTSVSSSPPSPSSLPSPRASSSPEASPGQHKRHNAKHWVVMLGCSRDGPLQRMSPRGHVDSAVVILSCQFSLSLVTFHLSDQVQPIFDFILSPLLLLPHLLPFQGRFCPPSFLLGTLRCLGSPPAATKRARHRIMSCYWRRGNTTVLPA